MRRHTMFAVAFSADFTQVAATFTNHSAIWLHCNKKCWLISKLYFTQCNDFFFLNIWPQLNNNLFIVLFTFISSNSDDLSNFSAKCVRPICGSHYSVTVHNKFRWWICKCTSNIIITITFEALNCITCKYQNTFQLCRIFEFYWF